jgi:hypothetical protein
MKGNLGATGPGKKKRVRARQRDHAGAVADADVTRQAARRAPPHLHPGHAYRRARVVVAVAELAPAVCLFLHSLYSSFVAVPTCRLRLQRIRDIFLSSGAGRGPRPARIKRDVIERPMQRRDSHTGWRARPVVGRSAAGILVVTASRESDCSATVVVDW